MTTKPFFKPVHAEPTVTVEVFIAHSDRAGLPVPADVMAVWVRRVERAVQALPGGGGSTSWVAAGSWGGLPDGTYEPTTVVRGTCSAWVAETGGFGYVSFRPLALALVEYAQATNQALVGLALDGVFVALDEAAVLEPVSSVVHAGLTDEDRAGL